MAPLALIQRGTEAISLWNLRSVIGWKPILSFLQTKNDFDRLKAVMINT